MTTNTSETISTESLKDIINSTTKASSDTSISNASKTTKVLSDTSISNAPKTTKASSDTSISNAPKAQDVPKTSSTSSTSSAQNTFTEPAPITTSSTPVSVATAVPVAASVATAVPVAASVATDVPVAAPVSITTSTETSSDNNINNQLAKTKYNDTIKNIKETFNTKHKSKFFLIILIFIFVIYFIGLYTLLTSNNKYDNLYNCRSDKFIIEINLTLTYLQIGISIILLYVYRKNISDLLYNNKLSTILILLGLIYFIYIISVMQLTYILINIDNYKEMEYYSLTKYYIFIQSLQCILLIYYIYKNF
jgi:hypothetical protein